MIANINEIRFPIRGDERGRLIVQEGMSEFVPFEIKRTYFIFDTTPGVVRGNHAHHRNRQMLICVIGACTICCELPNGTKSTYRLDCPNKGLLIEGMVWHDMREFSKDAVLLVLASEHYDETDYVRSYDDFKSICQDSQE